MVEVEGFAGFMLARNTMSRTSYKDSFRVFKVQSTIRWVMSPLSCEGRIRGSRGNKNYESESEVYVDGHIRERSQDLCVLWKLIVP